MNYVLVRSVAFAVMSSLCMHVHAMNENTDTKQVTGLVVREATLDDLDAVCAVDKEVTSEYFLPLMTQHYSKLYGDKTVPEGLEADLKADVNIFKWCVTGQSDKRLHVAYDTEKKCAAGFVLSQKDARTVNIDLLFVAQAYRRHGAGKKLLHEAIEAFTDVDDCFLYALDKNEVAHKVYTKLGFDHGCLKDCKKIDGDFGHPELYTYYTTSIAALKAVLSSNK
jgi:GNAT superfamily N-acetyltransferase